ncbi:MAG: 6-bladed beta-propeller [Bacteroidales bacterium]
MSWRNLILLLIILGLPSCWSESKNDMKQILVEKDDPVDLYLSDISNEVETIILETDDSCLLSHIMKIEYSENSIFIFDFRGPKVLQFSSTGKFIKKIGSKGRGPGEYPNLRTFTIDGQNKLIYFATSKKLMCYDFSGTFIREIESNMLVEDMACLDNELKILATEFGEKVANGDFVNTKRLYNVDTNLVITDSLLISRVYFKSLMGSDHPMPFLLSDVEDGFYIYSPELLYEPFLRDTIYKVIDNELVPHTKYDFGSEKELKDPKRSILIKNIYMSNRYTFLEFLYNHNSYFNLHDKESGGTWNMREGIIDDIYNSGNVVLRPLEEKLDLFYFTKDAYGLEGIIDGIHENDNPVLFLVKLKA